MLKNNSFDVIVVGAGPAGAIAAYHLAKAGLQVCVLEKAQLPRRKVCGGGLTHRAFKEIPFEISDAIDKHIQWGHLSFHGWQVGDVIAQTPIAYLVSRRDFDAALQKQAQSQGAQIKTQARVLSIEQDTDTVRAFTNDTIYQSQYLIGADGIHSPTAQAARLIPQRTTSLSYEARLTLPDNINNPAVKSITFDFGTILGGYGWIFPKKGHLDVGVFRSWPGKRVTKNHLLRFVQQNPHLRSLTIKDIRAFPVPLGGQPEPLHKKRILLAGDAANLADPWLGEGLYFALASGRMAAETILRCQGENQSHLSEYTHLVNDILVRQLAYARRLSLLINTLPLLNVAFLANSPTLQKMIVELLRGDKSHKETWQKIKKELPLLAIKAVIGK